jgi:hypothetical protein
MEIEPTFIGRVTRCSTRGFIGAVRAPEPELPVFGGFCKAPAQRGKSFVIGLIYNISIEDDELTRQMAAVDQPFEEELADQQYLRQVPIEYEALAIGYQMEGAFYYSLPPQPPLALAPIQPMIKEEILQFTEQLDFIPIILSSSSLPVDDLLAACLKSAASVRPSHEKSSFLIQAGKFSARLLADDLTRLDHLIRNLDIKGFTTDERR